MNEDLIINEMRTAYFDLQFAKVKYLFKAELLEDEDNRPFLDSLEHVKVNIEAMGEES